MTRLLLAAAALGIGATTADEKPGTVTVNGMKLQPEFITITIGVPRREKPRCALCTRPRFFATVTGLASHQREYHR